MLENLKDWAISSEAPNRRTFNDHRKHILCMEASRVGYKLLIPETESGIMTKGTTVSVSYYTKDMVYSLVKIKAENKMNIVYLLTNIDKTEFPNKYIGSKVECNIVTLDGIPTIIDNKSGNYYFGSSCCPIMKSDMEKGNRFKAEVLDIVWDKKELVKTENKRMEEVSAVLSDEYYNMGSALLDGFCKLDTIANCYGETLRVRASEGSSMSKRDAQAKKSGFNDFGEMSFFIHNKQKEGLGGQEISKLIGKERHYAARTIRDFDMEKAEKELPEAEKLKAEIRKHFSRQATLMKLKEMYGFEYPTLRLIIGDYQQSTSFKVAHERGLSKEELELEITKQILDGKDFLEVSREYGIVLESVKRYFFRCLRSRIKSSDLN